MTVTTSRVGVIIDALVSLLEASASLAPPVVVMDGPGEPPDIQGPGPEAWTDMVTVGWDGDPQGKFLGAETHQIPLVLGNQLRQETDTIQCAATHWTGDMTPKPSRDACLALVGAVDTAICNNPSLGVDGSTHAYLEAGLLFQTPFQNGLQTRMTFTVHVTTALISSV